MSKNEKKKVWEALKNKGLVEKLNLKWTMSVEEMKKALEASKKTEEESTEDEVTEDVEEEWKGEETNDKPSVEFVEEEPLQAPVPLPVHQKEVPVPKPVAKLIPKKRLMFSTRPAKVTKIIKKTATVKTAPVVQTAVNKKEKLLQKYFPKKSKQISKY